MFWLGVGIAACLELKEFADLSELTFCSISLELRQMEHEPGALVVTGFLVGAVAVT